MLPLNYDQAVLDKNGNIQNLTEYIEAHGGEDPEPISDSIVDFTTDDTIQNPTERTAMPLFHGGNALKDLMRWISKAFQNIRYILKYMDDISDDLNTTIEKVDDAAAYTAKEWADSTVAIAGEYYRYNNEIWKCLITNAYSPSPGLDWKKVLILDEVSELNSNLLDLGGCELLLKVNGNVSGGDYKLSDNIDNYRYLFIAYMNSTKADGIFESQLVPISIFKSMRYIELDFYQSSGSYIYSWYEVFYKTNITVQVNSNNTGSRALCIYGVK